MDSLNITPIGNINITVYQTEENMQFFYLKAENKKLLPVLDYLDNSLSNFKRV